MVDRTGSVADIADAELLRRAVVSAIHTKDKRDAIGNGDVARTLWEVRITTSNGGLNRRDGSVADGTSALKPLLGEDGGE